MQLRYEQLTAQLQKNLAPVYLLSGDVPLLMQEGCAAIRAAARKQDYFDRQILQVETGFAWQTLLTTANSLSLFSNKQLIELRFNNSSINEAASKALQTYAHKLPSDKILLITTGKLEAKNQQASWFQLLAKIGVVIQLWPLENAQLPAWIMQRLATLGLKADSAGIQILTERAEGNLLAIAQEIEKLHLLYGSKILTAEEIVSAVTDSARFDVFALSDAALQGDSKRVLRILASLQQESIEPTLILWALTRELRTLATMAYALSQNQPLEKIFQQQRVWEKRKPLFRQALRRDSMATWRKLIQQASRIDRMIKGIERGNTWNELNRLGLAMAGVSLCL